MVDWQGFIREELSADLVDGGGWRALLQELAIALDLAPGLPKGSELTPRLELAAEIIGWQGLDQRDRQAVRSLLSDRTPVSDLLQSLMTVTNLRTEAAVESAKLVLDEWNMAGTIALSDFQATTAWSREKRSAWMRKLGEFDAKIAEIVLEYPPDSEMLLQRRVKQTDAAVGRIRLSEVEAANAKKAAQTAAGSTGEALLGNSFGHDAKRDGRTAMLLSGGAAGSLVGAIGVGIWVVAGVHDITLPLVLAKLGLTIPLLGLSGYLGRLSSHYRDGARWARTAAVQLRSIEAFNAGFGEPESREQIRLVLGRRVFGDPGFSKSPKSMDTEDAVSIIDAIGRLPKKE
ncbi:hypothetical protein CH278_02055 [Rhodococcus sp. 05-2254-5]|uniref:hypothetical protein n=1 Tax=unclassified Rhodococcus (in: high G+C Gram-positive bacteria) TaxID=192944 RepID=UPI000B9BFA03|nr:MULTISPECIES: hypothetical protein [unclassified Rhodococcus (in: high G+C Gram-positive bacteria)]OZE39090.1 hypothetical protein CH278_02055 [Rhodococcus sp. 05-2254-5]OZE59031.1 hypothetical protein CH269_08550 [Rhodococcus sp. 05-2254-1]